MANIIPTDYNIEKRYLNNLLMFRKELNEVFNEKGIKDVDDKTRSYYVKLSSPFYVFDIKDFCVSYSESREEKKLRIDLLLNEKWVLIVTYCWFKDSDDEQPILTYSVVNDDGTMVLDQIDISEWTETVNKIINRFGI